MIETTMDGKKYLASRLAATWRRTLTREHIGLLPPQAAFDPEVQPTAAMHPAPVPHEYDFDSPEDLAVADFLSEDFQKLWIDTGRSNRAAFEKVFRPVPNDTIKSWEEYHEYLRPAEGIAVSLGSQQGGCMADGRLDMWRTGL